MNISHVNKHNQKSVFLTPHQEYAHFGEKCIMKKVARYAEQYRTMQFIIILLCKILSIRNGVRLWAVILLTRSEAQKPMAVFELQLKIGNSVRFNVNSVDFQRMCNTVKFQCCKRIKFRHDTHIFVHLLSRFSDFVVNKHFLFFLSLTALPFISLNRIWLIFFQ